MTIHQKFLVAALVAAGAIISATASQAQGISIHVNDRGYYTHGEYYEHNGYRMVWVPGHYNGNHHWIHGHYVQRGRWHGDRHSGASIHLGY